MLVNHPLWNSHGEARLQELRPGITAFGTATERAGTADALLKDADALLRLSLTFKRQANQLAPISRLPPETLIRILRCLSEDDHPEGRSLGWVRTTHVCHSWRSIFISESAVWANNIGMIPLATATFLDRSGSQAPLHFHFDHRLFWCGRYSERLSPLPLHRVHTLRCVVRNASSLGELYDGFCKARFLELRDLKTFTPRSEDNVKTLSIPDCIPCGAPALTSWRSQGVFLNIVAPRLTNLEINMTVPATALLRLFSGSPLLERFIGTWLSLETNDQYIHSSTLRVPLHHLREFQLIQKRQAPSIGNVYRQFLAHIEHPAATDVTFTTVELLRSASDLELLEFYLQASPQSNRWEATIEPEKITFRLKSCTSPIRHGVRNIALPFENIPRLVMILRERPQIYIQLEKIHKLYVLDHCYDDRWDRGRDIAELAEFYGALNNIHSVLLLTSSGFGHSGALAMNHPNDIKFPFPALRHLRIFCGSIRVPPDLPSSQEIIAWLEPRIRAGAGPSTISLECMSRPGVDAVVDPELLALIPDVQWMESEYPDLYGC